MKSKRLLAIVWLVGCFVGNRGIKLLVFVGVCVCVAVVPSHPPHTTWHTRGLGTIRCEPVDSSPEECSCHEVLTHL